MSFRALMEGCCRSWCLHVSRASLLRLCGAHRCWCRAGDVISCSGKGRVEVLSAELTKKLRYAVEMVRYV